MASISRSRRTTDEGSGGKMVRGRRIAAPKTPYDRPIPVNVPPQNPNWLTGVILPTSRMIAASATKLISSMINSDNSSSSSSSASDSSSEDFIDDENDNYHIPFDGVDGLNKNETTSQLIECFGKEPQLTAGKSETKCVIEKLLMQETFTREECDGLVKIINSRVVDGSTMEERQDGRLDLCSKAVTEAKQWLEEKKIASSSKSDMDLGICTPSSVVISQVTKRGLGSPVDVAKSYMCARPPWASPSMNIVESRTPSPIGRELLKEETPYSVTGNAFSSSKKIYSLASGSWNIQEEIRRVRSKATEDMLKTTPSMKTDLSSFSLEPKNIQKSLLADKTDLGRGEAHDLNYLLATQSVDASAELAAGVSPCQCIPALEMTQDGSQNEDLSLQPIISSAQDQNLVDIRTVEGEEHAASESHHPTIPDLALEHRNSVILSERACSSAKEESESRGNPNANGFPHSGPSLSADQNPRPSNDKNPSPTDSNHKKLANSIPPEDTCELLSEASMEVPVVNETNSIAVNSQNSSSMQWEELSSQEMAHLIPEHGKTNIMVDKQRGRKMTRNNRKSRAKG